MQHDDDDTDLTDLFAVAGDEDWQGSYSPSSPTADHDGVQAEAVSEPSRSEPTLEQAPASAAPEEPVAIDAEGIPMLYDIVIPGDYLRAAGVFLAPEQFSAEPPRAPAPDPQELEAAVEAALSAASERVANALREQLLSELQQRLGPSPEPRD